MTKKYTKILKLFGGASGKSFDFSLEKKRSLILFGTYRLKIRLMGIINITKKLIFLIINLPIDMISHNTHFVKQLFSKIGNLFKKYKDFQNEKLKIY